MIPATFSSAKTYDELTMPIIIIAGEDDRIIDIDEQSARLHDEVKQSKMHRIVGAGHMVQQSATGDVMAAIDEAAAETLHLTVATTWFSADQRPDVPALTSAS